MFDRNSDLPLLQRCYDMGFVCMCAITGGGGGGGAWLSIDPCMVVFVLISSNTQKAYKIYAQSSYSTKNQVWNRRVLVSYSCFREGTGSGVWIYIKINFCWLIMGESEWSLEAPIPQTG